MDFDKFIRANMPKHLGDCTKLDNQAMDCLENNKKILCESCKVYYNLCEQYERKKS